MLRALKFCGALILKTFVALIGTAVLESGVGKAFHPHSIAAIVWKEWSLSVLLAGLIGFGMWRTWRANASKWTWILLSLWFGMIFVPELMVGGGQSVLAGRSVWSHFSGTDCDSGVREFGCRNFLVFTIPFIRGVAYSVGAFVSSLVSPPRSQPAAESPGLTPASPPTAR